MSLSDRERRILQQLEEQFPDDAGRLGRWWELRWAGEWRDRLGWFALLGGFGLMLGLLMFSVLASFGAFLVAATGAIVLLTGPTVRRLALSAKLPPISESLNGAGAEGDDPTDELGRDR